MRPAKLLRATDAAWRRAPARRCLPPLPPLWAAHQLPPPLPGALPSLPPSPCAFHPAACQILRIISFTVTQLPAPNYHCRLGEGTAVREMPQHWWGHVVVDVGRQASDVAQAWAAGLLPSAGLPCAV